MKGYKKLGRNSAHRKSMLRNLVTDLFREGRITTLEYLFDEDVVTKLFDEIAPGYENRNGGYTRILKLGPRQGDNAEVVFLELV